MLTTARAQRGGVGAAQRPGGRSRHMPDAGAGRQCVAATPGPVARDATRTAAPAAW